MVFLCLNLSLGRQVSNLEKTSFSLNIQAKLRSLLCRMPLRSVGYKRKGNILLASCWKLTSARSTTAGAPPPSLGAFYDARIKQLLPVIEFPRSRRGPAAWWIGGMSRNCSTEALQAVCVAIFLKLMPNIEVTSSVFSRSAAHLMIYSCSGVI